MQKTIEQITFQILDQNKEPINFYKLWDLVKEKNTNNVGNDSITDFYMMLLLNKKFVMRGNNTWSIRDHYLYEDIKIDLSSISDKFSKTEIIDDLKLDSLDD